MITWDLHLRYKGKLFIQQATVEYRSKQIIRIRVAGTQGSLLLECDYPAIRFTNSKKGVRWKLRQGQLREGTSDSAALLVSMFSQLEQLMKEDFLKIYPEEDNLLFSSPSETHSEYLRRTKK